MNDAEFEMCRQQDEIYSLIDDLAKRDRDIAAHLKTINDDAIIIRHLREDNAILSDKTARLKGVMEDVAHVLAMKRGSDYATKAIDASIALATLHAALEGLS